MNPRKQRGYAIDPRTDGASSTLAVLPTRSSLRVVLLLSIAACDHTTPFGAGSYSSSGPFSPGSPVRITFSPGADVMPVWLPDGSGFLYTQEQTGRPDHDRCLARIPAAGGAITRTICPGDDLAGDSVDDFESPGLAAAGRMAYARTSMLAFIGRSGPDASQLVLGTYADPLHVSVLSTLPYFGPSGPVDIVANLHWVGPNTLVFLAQQQSYPARCSTCITRDTVRGGIDVERIDVGGGAPVLSAVSGTALATAVASDRFDTLYYTLAGSGQVHRRALSTGADTVVFDFGAPVADLSVSGSRFAAVVNTGMRIVDRATAFDDTFVKVDTNFHRPALSPDGHRVVVELAPFDTLAAHETPADLWMWTLP